jgi:putative PIG3 family NAD(P)H quinone oxidoreductase
MLAGMKAIILEGHGGPEVLQLREIPDPRPGGDEILVRVHATALNRADLLQREGSYPQPGPKPEHEVPGLEVAGEVVAAGPRVATFRPGDRVMALLGGGGYAELALVSERHAVRMPANLSWEEAGSIPEVFITAHDALHTQCGLQMGESVLIHACGSGVGVAAIQIAQLMGASTIIGTAGSAEKLRRAKDLGLDLGINYKEADFAEAVRDALDGRGVDVLLDVVGADYWERNIRSLAPRGRMVLVGLMGGNVTEANLGLLLMKRLQVRGTTLRARNLEEKALAVRLFEKSVLPHLASGRMKTVVDRVYPLAEAADAHRYLASNESFGKVVLRIA